VSKVSNGNLIEWKAVEGVSSYRLYRKTVGASWSVLADITLGNSYVDTSAKSDNVYTYTLRCLDANGNLISSYISDTKYYKNGVICNGNVTVGNSSYYFDNGKLRSGYQTINGKTYYHSSNGTIQKNCIVGSKSEGYKYASPSGVIIKSDEIQAAVDFVIAHGGSGTSAQKLKTCYNYLKNTFVYKRDYTVPSTNAHFKERALTVFNKKVGNCYAYGIAFACIARVLGYDARAITGQISSVVGGTTNHGWTEVYVNGQWLVCDVNMQWEISYLNFYQVTYASYPVKPFYSQAKYNITFDGSNVNWKKI
ncbi:MAG: transglutaminase domain-containing protein, partial [Ruminococcus sp.]|nr:transglutaminase domain-containing protein [Ruminococcus sp.]